MSVKPEAVIYTDGSCLGNPGPGGWASIVIVGGTTQEMSGGDPSTTNNRMELLGVINGLKSLRGPHIVKIFSDSKYITDAFNKYWLKSWKKNGWKRKDGPLRTRSCGRSWMPLRRSISAHSYGSRATPETSTMSGAMNWQSLRAGEQVVSGPTSGRPRLAKMTKLHRMIVQKAPRPLRRWRITSEQRIKRLSE